MPTALRVLIVEHRRPVIDSILYELRRADFEPSWQRVETAADYVTQLTASPTRPELILAAEQLPHFDGLSALQRLKERGLDIPFILIAEMLSEALVAAAMTLGAADCLRQDRLERLGSAVAYALAQQQLRASEARFQTLIENSADAIVLVDRHGAAMYSSPTVSRILGYTPSEFIGRSPFAHIHPDDVAANYALFTQLVRDSMQRATAQLRLRHKDGSWRWIEATAANLLAEPSIGAVVINYRDITERKQAEQEIQRRADQFAALYQTAAELAAQSDLSPLLQTIVTRATSLLATPVGGIYLYNASRNDLELTVFHGAALPYRTRVPCGEGVVGRVAQTREPLVIDDYRSWPHRMQTASSITFSAVLAVPMLYSGELVGVLLVSENRTEARKFTEADTQLLALFGGQAASAVHQTRLLAETRQRLLELETVNKVSTALRAARTLDEMLPILLDETLTALHTTTGSIWIYDETVNLLRRAGTRSWAARTADTLKASEGIVGHVFTTGQIYRTRSYKQDPRTYSPTLPQIPDDWGGAGVPIRTANEIIGVIFISVQLPRELSDREIHLLTTIAEIAGNAIHRTRLREQAEQQVQRLAALRSIDLAITANLELEATLGLLLEQGLRQLRVDAMAILLLDTPSQQLTYTLGRGFRTNEITHTQLRVGEGYAGRAASERRLVSALHLSAANEPFARPALLAAEQFVAYCAVPLIVKSAVKGVLEIFHRAPLTPDSTWLDFLETLAGQAAIAVDNAELVNNLQRTNLELALAYDTTLEGWSRALDLRDKETEGHTLRVTELTLKLAQAMGLSEAELVNIRRGALLHDIGKMGIPDHILLKTGPLNESEWSIMRKHAEYAHRLLSPIGFLHPALDIPYCHHERWDGTGYPRGLRGEEIPLAARIFAVVDVWDALRSDRPYRAAWPEDQVWAHIRSLAGTHFDPQVVEQFERMLGHT
jgi:PAS domain S-box-containing protein/putative nucleotidyltransferase with HDIG domain